MDNNPLTYVLSTAKLDATGHRWVAALSNYTFSIIYKPGKGHHDADALSHIKWPETMELTHRQFMLSVRVCKPTWQNRNSLP